MNPKRKLSSWDQMVYNFIFFVKYIDPVLILLSICGASFLFILIIAKKKEIRYPTTTVIAICWLLSADVAFLFLQLLFDLGMAKVMRKIPNESELMCYGFTFFEVAFLIMQGYVQAVISIERLLAVTIPQQVKRYITRFRMVGLLCLATVVSICVAIGFVKLGFVYIVDPDSKRSNVTVCRPEKVGLKVAIFILVAWVLPPAAITTTCTVGIIKTLVSRGRRPLLPQETRLSLMLVGMNIILLLTSIPMAVCYFTFAVIHSVKLRFFWNLSVFCTRFGTFTDWIIILLIGSHLRRALKKMCGMEKAEVSAVNSASTGLEMQPRNSAQPLIVTTNT